MSDNNDLFLKKMKGVTPIKKNNKIKKQILKTTNKFINKNTENKPNPNTNKPITSFKTQNFTLEKIGIKKNIKKGLMKIDKKIDFHGRGLIEAEEIFSATIKECYNNNKRCILFVTGKGLYKKNNDYNSPRLFYGIIRESFNDWVSSKKFSKYILSFEKASIEHGGDGAFYVYLRKKKPNLL